MTYDVRHTSESTFKARHAEIRCLDMGKDSLFTDWNALADALGDERRFDAWKRRTRALRFVR